MFISNIYNPDQGFSPPDSSIPQGTSVTLEDIFDYHSLMEGAIGIEERTRMMLNMEQTPTR